MALVGETQVIADLLYAVRTKLQPVLYELEPVLVDIIPKRHARLFFEKDAQVMPGVSEFFRQVLQVGMFRWMDPAVQVVDDGADLLCMLRAGMDVAGDLNISLDDGDQGLDEEVDGFIGAADLSPPFFHDETYQLVGFCGIGARGEQRDIPDMGFHENRRRFQVNIGEFEESKLCLFRDLKMMDIAGREEEKAFTGIRVMVAWEAMRSFSPVNEDDLEMIVVMHGVLPPGGGEVSDLQVLVLDITLHGERWPIFGAKIQLRTEAVSKTYSGVDGTLYRQLIVN